jgi:division/cell wall cluster transcriptional repressor MraZ
LYAQARSVEIDSQGRIRLPVELAQLAKLNGDVALIGVGDRIEVWNKQRWLEYLADLQPRYDELADLALSRGPTQSSPQQLPAQTAENIAARPMQPR